MGLVGTLCTFTERQSDSLKPSDPLQVIGVIVQTRLVHYLYMGPQNACILCHGYLNIAVTLSTLALAETTCTIFVPYWRLCIVAAMVRCKKIGSGYLIINASLFFILWIYNRYLIIRQHF